MEPLSNYPYPRLVKGRTYRLVMEPAHDPDAAHATPWFEASVAGFGASGTGVPDYTFEAYVGDWWAFAARDGLQHIIVNPAKVAYIEISTDDLSDNPFGNWG